jgi:hypothetical protein
MSPPNLDRYRLDPVAHEEIFRQEIIPEEGFDRSLSWQHPTAYLLGGQPGAGKSQTKSAVVPFTLDKSGGRPVRGGAIDFGSDTLRTYHPEYDRLQVLDDRTAAALTDTDARLWVDKTVDYAIERRANVVFDTTLSRVETAESIIQRFRDADYRVEVTFVAVPEAMSLLGNLQRYQAMVEQKGLGRICERQTHDHAYAGVLETAERIDHRRLADAVHVYRRGGQRLYTNHQTTDGDWVRPPGTVAAIGAERSRLRTPEESRELLAQIDDLAQRMGPQHQESLREITSLARPLLAPEVEANVKRDDVSLAGEVVRARNAVTVIRHQRTAAEIEELTEEAERFAEQARVEDIEQEIDRDGPTAGD